MSRFSLTVKLTRTQLRICAGNIDAAVAQIMAPYDEGPAENQHRFEWDGYRIGGCWSVTYPVKNGTDTTLVYRWSETVPGCADVLSLQALDLDTVRRLARVKTRHQYWQHHRDLFRAARSMGDSWVRALRDNTVEEFVERYSPCFSPILTNASLCEQGWIHLEKPTLEDPFWLGSVGLATETAHDFESIFITQADPNDVLISVNCHI